MSTQLHATEIALLAVGLLLLASVVAGRFALRSGVPVVLIFLGIGMAAGSEGIGGLAFDDYALSYRIGTMALVLILFDGGMRTPIAAVRHALAPAAVLATVGVVITAAVVGVGAHLLGMPYGEGLLLGSIVASTDAAAVFAVLRGGGVHLEENAGAIVEVESGLNDPMAVLLTIAMTEAEVGGHPAGASIAGMVAIELAIGGMVGAAVGFAGRAAVPRLVLRGGGLYPLLTTALAFATYGGAALLHGSGFLAVYVAAVLLGNGWLPYRAALLRVHDFVGWASQVVMFLVLGLLVYPSHLHAVAPLGFAIALLLVFVARPIAVAVCLAPFRPGLRRIVLVGWVGLRGAVPIVLAVIPILAGVPAAYGIFNVVFFVVIVSTVLQGGTARWVADRLGLATHEPTVPEAVLEIESRRPLDTELTSFVISEPAAVCGAAISAIPFPDRASAMLIVRGEELVAPRGDFVLEPDDRVYVFCRRADVPLLRLLFGHPDE